MRALQTLHLKRFEPRISRGIRTFYHNYTTDRPTSKSTPRPPKPPPGPPGTRAGHPGVDPPPIFIQIRGHGADFGQKKTVLVGSQCEAACLTEKDRAQYTQTAT